MIPRLFDGSATNYDTVGLGSITEVLTSKVTEERNGVYELEMTVLATTPVYDGLKVGNTIVALTSEGTKQGFDIYEVTKPMDSVVNIKAQHVTYRASYIPVTPFSETGITNALNGLGSHSMETNPFTLTTDFTNTETVYNQLVPKSLRACLGGSEGSILDTFGGGGAGEYYWDNFTIRFLMHRGNDNGVFLRYGKNITEFEQTANIDNTITGAVAYWSDINNDVVFYGDVQYSANATEYDNPRTIVLDVSAEFEEAPTKAQLDAAALAYVNQETISIPTTNITLSYIDLANTNEQAIFESVKLCDTVHVYYAPLGIRYDAKVVRTVWDVLAERYDEIEIGQPKSTLAKTLAESVGDISSVVKSTNKMVSVTQRIDRENGEIVQTVSSLDSSLTDLGNVVDNHTTQISQTAGSIQTMASTVQRIENEDIVQIRESVSNVEQTATELTTTFTTLEGTVQGNSEQLEEISTYITMDSAGITIGKSNSDVRGQFTNTSLDFIDNNGNKLAWLDADDGLGATRVSIGDATTANKRWNLKVSEDGSHFRITRHE